MYQILDKVKYFEKPDILKFEIFWNVRWGKYSEVFKSLQQDIIENFIRIFVLYLCFQVGKIFKIYDFYSYEVRANSRRY